MTLTPRSGRHFNPDKKSVALREKVIELRKKGLGPQKIAKQLGTYRSFVERIIYPKTIETQNKLMMQRYHRMREKGLCHQCGQKRPKN